MLILYDEDTLLHETVELLGSRLRPALESPERIKAIVKAVEASPHHDLRKITANEQDQTTAVEVAKATHDAGYLSHIQNVFKQWLKEGLVEEHESVLPECFRLHNFAHDKLKPPKDIYARAGYYAFDMSTGISKHSWRAIIASANLAIRAAHELLVVSTASSATTNGNSKPQQSAEAVLALCRPPGHHCTPSQAGGYCYMNNVALTITTLRQFSPEKSSGSTSSSNLDHHLSVISNLKFAILDLDFHHGNGTQEMFYHDACVFYASIHGEDEFPYYTGSTNERGPSPDHPAWDTNLNLPLAVGSSFEQYLEKLSLALGKIQEFNPQYLLISLGFDTFYLDPLGKFQIHSKDYAVMANTVRSQLNNLPTVILFEGGYVVEHLGENLLSFLQGWESAEV